MIRQSGDDLLRVVSDILDASRLEAGRLVLSRAWTPSVEIVTEAVHEARQALDRNALRIATELEPGLPPVHVDKGRVVQALVGVLDHVGRVMVEGTVEVRARVADGPPGPARHLRVEIIDASAGIREADRERIFEAFREMRQPSGKRIGGLGLSLSLARRLVTEHGGELWYEAGPSGSTTFCMALPL